MSCGGLSVATAFIFVEARVEVEEAIAEDTVGCASASCPSLSLCSGDHQLLSAALYNACETHSPSERTVLWGRMAFHLVWSLDLDDLFRSILDDSITDVLLVFRPVPIRPSLFLA